MSGGCTLPIGPEPVEVPLLGPVELRASVAFWIDGTLHAAEFPHRMLLRRSESAVRAHGGRAGALQVRRRKVREEA